MRGWRAALAACALPGAAEACELALVLAQDVSSSVDAREFALQQTGVATALTDPDVMEAIAAIGGVWLYSFEWSGRNQQVEHLPWTFIHSAESIRAAAARIGGARRSHDNFPTALGWAVGHALIRLRAAPERCLRQVVDVAGDGVTNDGFLPRHAYAANDMTGVTVNALAIDGRPSPVRYYREHVLYGPGAFLEVADGFEDYARAMKKKLLREISIRGLAALDAPGGPD